MMTIKIIQHYIESEDRQTGRPLIWIVEAEDIRYKMVDFENRGDFLEKTEAISLDVVRKIGFPDFYYAENSKSSVKGMLAEVFYWNEKEQQCLILCQNCTIYIMQGGQTIDVIKC